MNWLIERIKWLVAGEELATLHRYRTNLHSIDRWFASHEDIVQVARWLKQYSEPHDDPNDPPSGWSISRLRQFVEGHKADQEIRRHG